MNKILESKSVIVLHVKYNIKTGKRTDFLQKVKDYGVITGSCKEVGNIYYEYSLPLDEENSILLIESWTGDEALAKHFETPHFKKLSELKDEYIESTDITKYEALRIVQ